MQPMKVAHAPGIEAYFTDGSSRSGGLLAPDQLRRFQRSAIDPSELHQYLVKTLKQRFGKTRPRIILCCGKCRVGSTPLANVFGHAGLPAFYQPIKTLLRYRLVGEACPPWSLETEASTVFVKETLGPYVTAECTFTPLRVLLDAGFRQEDIKLVVIERDPQATIQSWWRCWHDRISPIDLPKIFLLASLNVQQTALMAADHGIDVEYYFHEEAKEPETAVSRLFTALGLGDKFSASILNKWTMPASPDRANTAVTFFPQPNDYWIEDIHLERDEYRFVSRGPEAHTPPLQDEDKVVMERLHQFYIELRERTDRVRQRRSQAGASLPQV